MFTNIYGTMIPEIASPFLSESTGPRGCNFKVAILSDGLNRCANINSF